MMKKMLLFFLIGTIGVFANHMDEIDKGIDTVAASIKAALQQAHIRRVAVGHFRTNGMISMFERYIENEIVNALVSKASDTVQVIERRRLSEVLQEQKLGSMGLLEKSTRAAIGKILGAGAIISGETIVTSDEAKVNVRLYAVTTGKILDAQSFTLTRNRTIDELMAEAVTSGKKELVMSEHASHPKFRNRAQQKIGYLLVRAEEVQVRDREIVVTLRFVSMHRKAGAAIAVYAEGSDNIADFWKFFPKPKIATLTDSDGRSYRFKSTTLKYGKTQSDWTKIYPGEPQIEQFVFAKEKGEEVGKTLTFSFLVYLATVDKQGNARMTSKTLYLDHLRAN